MKAFTKVFDLKDFGDGCRFTFYCDICVSGYVTPLFRESGLGDEELFRKAQRDAKLHFTHCHACGQWVCDIDYNVEACRCVKCAQTGKSYKSGP